LFQLLDNMCRESVEFKTALQPNIYRIVTYVVPRNEPGHSQCHQLIAYNLPTVREIITSWKQKGFFKSSVLANAERVWESAYENVSNAEKVYESASGNSSARKRKQLKQTKRQEVKGVDSRQKHSSGMSNGSTSATTNSSNWSARSRSEQKEIYEKEAKRMEKYRSIQKKRRLERALRPRQDTPRAEFEAVWHRVLDGPSMKDEEFLEYWTQVSHTWKPSQLVFPHAFATDK